MKVRTFYAQSMQEAIRAIKQELGSDAVILSTRRVRKWGNAFGMLGSSALEVMAAIDQDGADQDDQSIQRTGTNDGVKDAPASSVPSFAHNLEAALIPPAPAAPRCAKSSGGAQSRDAGPDFGAGAPVFLSKSLQGIYGDLIGQGIRQETAYDCLRQLQDTLRDPDRTMPHFMLQLLRGVLSSRLQSAGPLLTADECQKIVVFAGPSGVGKTTTIAKLAAHYRLEEKRSVAMVTIDNYRPAAVEQLRLYANVLGVELATASTGDEARDCIGRLGQTELVLVDTPGFNPRHEQPWHEWTALTGLAHRLEVHLVVSATTRIQDIEVAVKRCADAPVLRLLFTKLDETAGYGSIFEAAHQWGIPLSYWGTGPRVPEDLAPAMPDRLIDLVLGATVPVRGIPERPAPGVELGLKAGRYHHPGEHAVNRSVSVTSEREHQHE
ncbi:MAG: flagellar biosynthesis protein FlhF [Nitrospira sp.]